MRKKVGIVTDSTSCLPPELVGEYEISQVPIVIVHEGRSYRDGIDLSHSEVYEIMRRRKKLPTTSTPSPGDFLDTFHKVSEDAEAILCITLTSLQSKVFDVALLARQRAGETIPKTHIEVIDSRSVGGALGFIVLEAARVSKQGADLDQAIDAARSTMDKVCFIAVLDTLYYLARTGRVAKAAAWVSSLLNIKPILEHYPSVGETTPVARPRSRRRATERMLKIVSERIGDSTAHVIVHHADELSEGESLRAEIGSRFNCAELYLTELTPGMGVHTGPGVLGLSFYVD